MRVHNFQEVLSRLFLLFKTLSEYSLIGSFFNSIVKKRERVRGKWPKAIIRGCHRLVGTVSKNRVLSELMALKLTENTKEDA